MKRIILGLILPIALINSAFAFTVHNGRLLDHREWTTGHTILRIKDSPASGQVKLVKLLLKEMKKNNIAYPSKDGILLNNKLFEDYKTGVVGVDSEIAGVLNFYIENFHSSISKTYKIYSNFCLRTDCVTSSYDIQLDPGGWFEMDMTRHMTFNVDKPGVYKAILTTVIDSDYLPSYFGTSAEGSVKIVD